MKTPNIGPLGLSLLSFVPLLVGCEGMSEDDSLDSRAVTVSVSITALGQIENVQSLTLEFSPLYLWVDHPDDYAWNYQVFTDSAGNNRVSKKREERPSDCDAEGEWVDNPNYPGTADAPQPQYIYVRVGRSTAFECGWVPHSYLSLLDAPAVNPLPTAFIARNYRLGDFAFDSTVNEIWFSPYGSRLEVRGAYLQLSDGRECPVIVPHLSEHWPVTPAIVLKEGEFWHIKIAVDFGLLEPIDLARCTQGYEVRVNVRSVTAEQMQGPVS